MHGGSRSAFAILPTIEISDGGENDILETIANSVSHAGDSAAEIQPFQTAGLPDLLGHKPGGLGRVGDLSAAFDQLGGSRDNERC